MRKGRRVWDQMERRFVTGWLGRTEARTARNTIEALTPGAAEAKQWNPRNGQWTRRFILSGKRKRKK